MKGQTVTGRGISGTSTGSGTGVVGYTDATGTGVSASAANANGKALEVSGPMKIAGPGQSPGNGKVLTSDGNGNATWENISGDVAFRASGILGGGNGNVIPDQVTKVAFANENYDLGDDYKNANASPHSTFIVPKKGIYHFDISVGWNCGSSPFKTFLNLALTRSGNFSIIGNDITLGKDQGFGSISIDIQLEQGDQLHVQLLSSSSETSETLEMTSGYFTGRLLF